MYCEQSPSDIWNLTSGWRLGGAVLSVSRWKDLRHLMTAVSAQLLADHAEVVVRTRDTFVPDPMHSSLASVAFDSAVNV